VVIGALDACSFKGVLVFGFENCPEQKNKYLVSGVFGSEFSKVSGLQTMVLS
jgi:hypothetical protein